MPLSSSDGVSRFSRAGDPADPRDALVAILDEMAGMLDASHARIADRLRAVTAAIRVAPRGGASRQPRPEGAEAEAGHDGKPVRCRLRRAR